MRPRRRSATLLWDATYPSLDQAPSADDTAPASRLRNADALVRRARSSATNSKERSL